MLSKYMRDKFMPTVRITNVSPYHKIQESIAYLPDVGELYVAIEHKQRFVAFKFFRSWITSSMKMFRMNHLILELFHTLDQLEDPNDYAYFNFKVFFDMLRKHLKTQLTGASNPEANKPINTALDRISLWTPKENKLASGFISCGYKPLMKIAEGRSTRYYMATTYSGTISLIAFDAVKVKDELVMTDVEHVDLSSDLIHAMLQKINYGKDDVNDQITD